MALLKSITIKSYIIEDKWVFLSDDFPDLFVSNKDYDKAYIELAYTIEPFLIKKFKDNAINIQFEDINGVFSLH